MLTAYLFLLIALTAKHYVADIPLQTNWMALNKGTFLHPGGLVHAGLHALTTLAILGGANLFGLHGSMALVSGIAVTEFLVHYTIDWTKMNADQWSDTSELVYNDDGKTPKGRLITSYYYYWLLVGDQCLHFLTYIVIGWWFLSYL